MAGLELYIAGAVFLLLPIALLSGKFQFDVIALSALGALLAAGVVTSEEAFSGFASPTLLVLITTRVLASALERTGATDKVGEFIATLAGSSERKAMLFVLLVSATFSACLSNLITVALLLPSALVVSRQCKVVPSLLLIPLSFGAILGGMLTLIGTAPNLVASDLLRARGIEPFHFFTFTPYGLSAVTIGALLFFIWGRRILPRIGDNNTFQSEPLPEVYRLNERLFTLKVPESSPLANQTLQSLKFTGTLGGRVVAIIRGDERNLSPKAHDILKNGDELLVVGRRDELEQAACGKLEVCDADNNVQLESSLIAVVEAIVTPRSTLIGRSLAEAKFGERYDFSVIAVWREGRPVRSHLGELTFRVGDALLLQGPRLKLELLEQRRDLVVVSEPSMLLRRKERRWLAVGAFALMIMLSLSGLQPAHCAAFFAALFVVLGGAVRMDEVYRDVEWRVIVFVAAVLPLGVAIERTGFVGTLAGVLESMLGGHGPYLVFVVLALFASILSQLLDSAVSVVMLAPFVFDLAKSMNLDPRALMMIVALGSSIAFLAPFSNKANILVMGAAGYRSRDFFIPGAILSTALFAVFLFLVPMLFGT